MMKRVPLPPWVDREEYPFEPRAFVHRGSRLSYLDEGAGEAAVFVHGNPSWSFMFRRQILDLRDRYRCLALDHLGFGLSEKPASAAYTPQAHAERFARFMDAVESEPVHLVVHDWGGPIGLSWALEHPGRVRSLAILNTWMWSLEESSEARRFSAGMGSWPVQQMIRRLGLFERRLMPRSFANKSLYDRVLSQYRRPFGAASERAAVAEFPRQVVGASEWLSSLWRRRGVLADLPVSIFWALDDPVFRKAALERWTGAFPAARVERIPGVGHYLAEEMGSRLSPLLAEHLAAAGSRDAGGLDI
ncbi:MAG: alpha/beta fold hydrolase [Acidobacteriota bacterium]